MQSFQFRLGLAAAVFAGQLMAQQAISTSFGTFTLIDVPDSTNTQVWGVNGRSEMVGVYIDAAKVTHGFLYSRGKFTSIDYPGSALTLANNINAHGDIVGEYATTPTGPHHGFLLSSGRFTTIDFPGSSTSAIVGIASNGDMVGGYNSPTLGYFQTGDQFSKVEYPGASAVVLGSISPQGDIIGSFAIGSISSAFVIRKGVFTVWDHPNAAGFTNAIGMNAAGDIVGRYRDSASVSHGYLLSNGQFTSFDYPGATFTGAAGITPDGDIVGRCTLNGVTHGFLVKRGRQPRYQVTDLGTLGGNGSAAYGINNAGVISGGANVANGDQHPFVWQNGKLSDLGGLGGGNGAGSIPSGSMQIALASETTRTDPFGADFCGYGTSRVCQAAIWNDGKVTALPTPGGNNAIGYAFNQRGQIVGVAETSDPDPTCPASRHLGYVPVIWGPAPGEMQKLALPQGDTVGWAILSNDRGEAIGASGTCDNTAPTVNGALTGRRAILWENGAPRDLGNFGGDQALAVGLNDRTEVVGSASIPGGDLHGFLWSRDNGMEDIGAIGDDPNGLPSSINNARQAVGSSCDAQFNCRAFLWERYTMTDLNELVPADSPLYLVFATWINDVGEIVGFGVDNQTGDVHAFLARPTAAAAPGTANVTSLRRQLPRQVRSRLERLFPGSK
jgi:probable HAF family extracellular repeat protein